MTFWARTTKNLRRPGDIEHALILKGTPALAVRGQNEVRVLGCAEPSASTSPATVHAVAVCVSFRGNIGTYESGLSITSL